MRFGLIYWLLMSFLIRIGSALADQPEAVGYYLFADRSWALSGDTVWFKLAAIDNTSDRGNVVHVQLENQFNEPVGRVMVVTQNGRGEGYLPVPDSLRTGTYWLYAYTSLMRNSGSAIVPARLLTVYHRFDENFDEISAPLLSPAQLSDNNHFKNLLRIDKSEAKTREMVTVTLNALNEILPGAKSLVISAFMENPITDETEGILFKKLQPPPISGSEDYIPEINGFLLEGRVTPISGNEMPARSLVLLSISDSIPWFDYYFAQSDGYFRFNLKNVKGTADIYLRAFSEDNSELNVELSKGLMSGAQDFSFQSTLVGIDRAEKIKSMTEAAWFEKVFSGEPSWKETPFETNYPYDQPFYGKPDRRIVPSEFIDLPDFQEISRELLPGVRYRRRGNATTLQLMNNSERTYFDRNPLRLVNGIPIFDDGLLYRFRSTDINYIDIIYQERVFGDISFKGVLAISLHDKENNWTTSQKTLFKFTIPCLQINIKPSYRSVTEKQILPNQPDFRRIFMFSEINADDPDPTFRFNTSDLKGTVIVRLQGVTRENIPFDFIRKIEVK